MSYSSELTKARIVECAIQEFSEKGYINANIRNIAKNAKVTTGAIYNHFGSKENLFSKLVEETAEELLSLFEESHHIYDDLENYEAVNINNLFDQTTGKILNYFYDNWTEVHLLFLSSAGSAFANFCDSMIEIEERSALTMRSKNGVVLDQITRLFIHVIVTSSIHQLIEVIRHNLTKEESVLYMKKIQEFYSQGMEKTFWQ